MANRFVPHRLCNNHACVDCWSVLDTVQKSEVCGCTLPVARTLCRLLNKEFGETITDISEDGQPIATRRH